MSDNLLVQFAQEQQRSASKLRDRVQVALAIADTPLLKSLLVDSRPPIAQRSTIGEIASLVGVPMKGQETVDGLIRFESIRCVLAPSQPGVENDILPEISWEARQRVISRLTSCESETRTLGQGIPFAQALSMLSHAGFSSAQIDAILNLSYSARHRTWWYVLDRRGNPVMPFHRAIRTFRYNNGTFTIQYQDRFAEEKPPCFKSQTLKALVAIRDDGEGFGTLLQRINCARKRLNTPYAILVSDGLSEREAQGFINQHISLYAAEQLILPTHANCSLCMRQECPMQGHDRSPVMMCRRFCLDGNC